MNDKFKLLQEIETEIRICTKCPLYKTSNCSVAGEGFYDAELVFIGEAPGASEDKTGKPFVGLAGKLLNKNLDSIKITRKDIWIGNIIKHRPPGNRNPSIQEIKACETYLKRQLDIIKPKLIVTLGKFALNFFLPETVLSESHGKLLTKADLNIYPIYHPAAALRNGEFKKTFVQDFLQIPAIIETISSKNN